MKSGDEQVEGTHVFQWQRLTIVRRGATGCSLTSPRACEGVVGILDYPPEESIPTKHLRKEVDAAQNHLDTLNEAWPTLKESQDAAMEAIFDLNEIQGKFESAVPVFERIIFENIQQNL